MMQFVKKQGFYRTIRMLMCLLVLPEDTSFSTGQKVQRKEGVRGAGHIFGCLV